MSARELKAELHQKIEALTDEQTLEVYEFINSQLVEVSTKTTPEKLEELQADLEFAQQTNFTGITTSELQQKMKQWLTR